MLKDRLLYVNHTDNDFPVFRIDNFIIIFYLIYLTIALCGNLMIQYNHLSFNTLFIYLIYSLMIFFGTYLGFHSKKNNIIRRIRININYFMAGCLLMLIFVSILTWYLIIHHFGSLTNVFHQAYNIRQNEIGRNEGLVPVKYSYLLSIVYACFCISLAFIGNNINKIINNKRIYLFPILFFIIIMLVDLTSFGRVGILFAIFCIIGFVLIYKLQYFNLRNLSIVGILYIILSLPRLIRGGFDNFKGTVNNFYYSLKTNIPFIFYSLISVYVYYFSSIYALDDFLRYYSGPYTYGTKLFTPVFNFISRFFTFSGRINLIEPSAHIPFEFNIYSIIKDILCDFGYTGLFFIPLLSGLFIGYIFRYKSIFFDALKIFMLGWLFYTPVYNILSFGSFFISFIFLFFLAFIFKEKNEQSVI